MDLTQSIEPRSDQVNADDLIAGPITYTVREVIQGKAEQPFDFVLVETDRAYRPSKTMRRVIVNAWGPEAANYAGRRLTLYREPTIKFGGQEVGGIRISAMSHIDGRLEVMAQTTRGKREKFVVEPLTEPTATNTPPPVDHDSAGVTRLQLAKIMARFNDLSVTDRGQRLALTRALLDLPDLTSANELSKAQASQLIDVIEDDSVTDAGDLFAAAGILP